MIVAIKFDRLAPVGLKKACSMALSLLGLTIKEWKSAMMAPSYSTPPSWLKVIGLNDFHKIVSLMFVAINNDMPEPIP